jgi:hypothetical protein
MLYALNGSAMNGWATLFGGGGSTPDLSASGTTAAGHVVKGPLASAALDISATAGTVLARLASGALALDLTAHHGLPDPMPLPGAIHAARGQILVPPRAAALRVGKEGGVRVVRERLPRVAEHKEKV